MKLSAARTACLLILFWLYVGAPLAWGIWSTVRKALALFD